MLLGLRSPRFAAEEPMRRRTGLFRSLSSPSSTELQSCQSQKAPPVGSNRHRALALSRHTPNTKEGGSEGTVKRRSKNDTQTALPLLLILSRTGKFANWRKRLKTSWPHASRASAF